jgi:hypothetical protein
MKSPEKHASIALRLMILLIVLAHLSFSVETFGYSRIKLERTWVVLNATGATIDLHGALSVNNSNQHILSVTTSPNMTREMKDGVLWVTYHGMPDSDNFTITGTVIADIDYDPHILSDNNTPVGKLDSSDLTAPDEGISSMARSLAKDESSLETIRSITQWVHDSVKYDIHYWGQSKSAQDVFKERRGVCVEYTHLLISMLRSQGFETRYVSGYIFENGWQQHAWAEVDVPGYGWLPADATFGQIGILDNTHFGVHYGRDQSDTFDTLTSTVDSVDLQAFDIPAVMLQTTDSKGVAMSMSMDKETYIADIAITNTRPEYVFGSYSFLVPSTYGADTYGILLLHPNQVMHRFHGINSSLFQAGFTYTIPVQSTFNDAYVKQDVKVAGTSIGNQSEVQTEAPPRCLPSALIIGFICLMAFLADILSSKSAI